MKNTQNRNSNDNKKKKKPIFLRWWFILVAIIAVGVTALSLSSAEKVSEIDWTQITLGSKIPIFEDAKGKINYESSSDFSLTIQNVSDEQFKEYKNKCITLGYTVDCEENGTNYTAFNSEGYELSLSFFSDEIHIRFTAPEVLDQIEWPKNGLGAMLPKPDSSIGRISYDSSETFIVRVGNISIDGYSAYVEDCEERGFTNNYSKDSKYYYAENSDGYKLTLRYLGFNRIEISLKAPNGNSNNANNNNSDSLGKTFKEAMDSYEAFVDEYVTFMKKYMANPTDTSLLSAYAQYLTKYADAVNAFEKWEEEDLNSSELAYYAQVQSRVAKKLLEIAK